MNFLKSKAVVLVATMMLLTFSLAGCGSKTADTQAADTTATTEATTTETTTETTDATTTDATAETTDAAATNLTGTVTISGSTSVEKIGLALAEEFMALNPDVQVTYESIGSSGGIKNANDGTTQIGTTSRNLKEEEKAWGLTEATIAYDGIAAILNPANTVKDLTMDQLKAIYKGEIKNWKEVGGNDEEIVVVSREDGSGTRGGFEELVGFEKELTSTALIAEGNGNVQTTVAGNPKAIGYVSFSYVDDTVKAVTVNGVEPTAEKVLSNEYPISRSFIMVFTDKNMTDVSTAFVDYILSEDGQAIVEENHGIPVQ